MTAVTPENVLAVVLAGGQASRMGGGDKGRLMLGRKSLIEHVITRLAPQAHAIVLSANGDAARFSDLHLPVLADDIAGQPGPLAGILAAMEEASQRHLSHVLSAAADTPFLPRDLCERLGSAGSEPIAMAATEPELGGRLIRQPVMGLWPVSLRHDLRSALEEGVSKVGLWAGRHGVDLVSWPVTPVDPFFNINTPQDLVRAQQLLASVSEPDSLG